MAQRKDSPNRPTESGGGDAKTAGAGGGRGASSRAAGADRPQNTAIRREKASPSTGERGETSAADRT